jgi:hypothetical protein
MAQGGFAVSLKLVDLASSPLAKINQNIAGFEKSVTRIGRNTGFLQTRDALILSPGNGQPDVFVGSINAAGLDLQTGDEISFAVDIQKDGRTRATNVELVRRAVPDTSSGDRRDGRRQGVERLWTHEGCDR